MSSTACPWCGDPSGGAAPQCPRCGRDPALHPSRSGGGPGLGLDLELAAPARPAPAKDPRSAPLPSPDGSSEPAPVRAATAPVSAIDDDLGGFDDWAQVDLNVDLDMGSVPPPGAASAAPSATDAPARRMALDDGVDPVGPPRTQAPATSAAAPPMALAPITDAEIEAVAQFGPKPAKVFLTPMYAFRVFRRKPELSKMYALRQQTHEAGVRGLRRQRKEIFEALSRRQPQSVQALQAGLDAADAAVMQQQSHFSQQNQVVAQQLDGLATRRKGLEEQLGQRRRDHQLAQVAVEETRRRQNQLETDIARLVDRIARAGQAPGTTGRVDVAALEREKQGLAAQVPTRKQAVQQAQQVAQQRRRELQALERDIQGVDQQVGQAERSAQATQASTFNALNAAQDARLDAYDDALRNVMEQAPQLLEAPEKQRLSELEENIASLGKDLEVHRRAVTAYDETARRQGVGIAVVVVVALLLFLASLVRVG